MNYVNINGQRMNLNLYLSYWMDSDRCSIVFEIPVQYEQESVVQSVEVHFETEQEAQQCIDFLDQKTKCKTFKLAVTE